MRQANRDASTKKIARRHTNVIHARNRFAEARRRRETASRAEFETFARRFPKIILKAVLTAREQPGCFRAFTITLARTTARCMETIA